MTSDREAEAAREAEARRQADMARAEREAPPVDAIKVVQGFVPPILAFVVGGVILLLLPEVEGAEGTVYEMLALAGLVYTSAQFGRASAVDDEAGRTRWRNIALAWLLGSVILSVMLRV